MRWWDRFPKKLAALVVGLVIQILPIPQEVKEQARNIIIAFLGAQGLADFGKGKAEVEVKRLAMVEQQTRSRLESDAAQTRARQETDVTIQTMPPRRPGV